MTPRVFISSTSVDLEAYRRAAWEECNRLGMLPIVMELFEAMAKGAGAGSRRKLDDADLYVGIFAHRYGFIEEGSQTSVTECEFDHAGERKLDRLCFLVEPGHTIGETGEEESQRLRLEAFKRRIEGSVIRARFTTVDDFRGKLRLALQEWLAGDAKARLPQPALTSNVLQADGASRFTYRARRTPFVGRQAERAALDRFLAPAAALAWLVVGGPGGVGKSRLVQEFCLAAAPAWRAGFLVPKQAFDWTAWQPNADTLLAIDYAAERVDEVRAVLAALLARAELSVRVRVLLIERDAGDTWMQALIGSRSEGYPIEQARSAESPLLIGGLAPDELWAAIQGVLRAGATTMPAKDALLDQLKAIDPDGRPLFAAFAADALAAGRDLRAWDRDRLLRDVLARERQAWAAAGVPAPYENLLALVTAVGGDTEQMLDPAAPAGGAASLPLPTFRAFERTLFHAMSGCGLAGDTIPALKPDLLGEFFVLEHVTGRNERVTALQADELMSAAWRVRGGTRSEQPFGALMTYMTPSSLIEFLTRVVDDFPDHPATRHLLRRPQQAGADLRYWATLVAIGIRRHALRGDAAAAKALFDDLAAMAPDALRAIDGEGGFIRAGLYLLPVLAKDGNEVGAHETLARVRAVLAQRGPGHGETREFCEAAQEAIVIVLAQGSRTLVDELIAAQAGLVQADAENQDLRLPYARALAATVRAPGELVAREHAFETLFDFCKALQDDVLLYEPLAAAALALCIAYAADPNRLVDVEAKNRLIRALARRRAERPIYRFKAAFSLDHEPVVEDLRQLRLYLIASNAELVAPWALAGRDKEAWQLLDEVRHLWRRFHPRDIEFARGWATVIVRHADARARQGVSDDVPKAVDALQDAAAEFDHDASFARLGSELCRAATVRAADQREMSTADAMLGLLRQAAERDGAPEAVVADHAEAAFAVCLAYQAQAEWEAFTATARAAARAIRSEAYRARLLQRGTDQAGLDQIAEWIDAVDRGGEPAA